ncbi:MAG: hypothetical protein AAF762_15565, partial [Pseudomonadota bacterium]
LLIGVGAWFIVGNVETAILGTRLASSDQSVSATVVEKHIDRPARRPGIRTESISVNGQRARHPRTYFNSYFLTVGYIADGVETTARAPVSYDQWHDQSVGDRLTVATLPTETAYVDAAPRGVLNFAFQQFFIGFAIAAVGLIAYRLQ